jgi:FkbM family methyltransferase
MAYPVKIKRVKSYCLVLLLCLTYFHEPQFALAAKINATCAHVLGEPDCIQWITAYTAITDEVKHLCQQLQKVCTGSNKNEVVTLHLKDVQELPTVLTGPTKYGTMSYYSHDVHFSRTLAGGKMFDELSLDRLVPYIQASNVILDVGSHCGSHSVAYAHMNPTAKIFAFEPQKRIFKLLEKNIADNNLGGRVVAHNFALGNKECAASMGPVARKTNEYLNPFIILHDGQSHVPADAPLANLGGMSIGTGGESIEIKKLDNLMNIVAKYTIDYIKIDVEGFEDVFIDGAKTVIERDLPVIFYENNEKTITKEMNGTFEPVQESIREFLLRHSYIITHFPDNNYLAVPPGS